MFTGIIEELGQIQSITHGSKSARLVIKAEKVLEGVKLGDSIAVNGICLTVTNFSSTTFEVDVMAETLKRTDLVRAKAGTRVNLERALRLSDRLGGHLVSGHVDGVGTIIREERQDIARVLEINAPPTVLRYTLEKGSIAVDGISLTVVKVTNKSFVISLIPHTAALTTLGLKRVGDRVNLEADIIGKYVEKLLEQREVSKVVERNQVESESEVTGTAELSRKEGVTLDFLIKHGFA